MKRIALLALPILLFAAEAAAQPPFRNAVTPAEMAALRGGAAVSTLPTIRLWDEVGARNPTRPAVPGAVSLNGGTITIRVGR